MSASPAGNASPSGSGTAPVNKHILTPTERQRLQLERLLANPDKEVVVASGPVQKTLRPPREEMKNVQGSSAGAGSGEFHVYKQSRRREYERLKIMEDTAKAEQEAAEFAARQKARVEAAEAKTSKNRARRLKRKAGGKAGAAAGKDDASPGPAEDGDDSKRRKLGGGVGSSAAAGGKGIVFRRPGEESDGDEEEQGPTVTEAVDAAVGTVGNAAVPLVQDEGKIVIHDSD
ncbi:hypothetical protein NCC49_003293 [Naganishia albida]|nr:hypothetical protein NCC49_003293 [Naganishia albida]